MITVITPTCDRPEGLALTERWMARQTLQPGEWIVVDGGTTPAICRRGQRHIWRAGQAGSENFVRNVMRGLEAAQGDPIIFWEDDDYYAPTHLEQTARMLTDPGVWLAGDPLQRYYHVGMRQWRTFNNKGASLCQTGLRREAMPWCQEVLEACLQTHSYGVDGRLWVPVLCGTMRGTLRSMNTVVGIKGLPGQHGLGIGHRPPIVKTWKADPELETLRSWIGDDAAVYAGYYQPPVSQPVLIRRRR